MKQDLQRAQSLFTSAERELRYEKEKNLDLKRHNTLLDQEKLKVGNQHTWNFLNCPYMYLQSIILITLSHSLDSLNAKQHKEI